MAEGDTILRLARRIEQALSGREVAVRAPHPRGRAAGIERLGGATLISAAAHGKHLLLTFRRPPLGAPSLVPKQPHLRRTGGEDVPTGDLVLHSHLGMNGGWHLYHQGERWRRPERSAWAVISTPPQGHGRAAETPAVGGEPPLEVAPASAAVGRAGIELVQFGGPTLRLLRPEQLRRDPALNSLGPDILAPEPSFDLAVAAGSLRAAADDATLGEALLDQRRIAGIGNIFKSEGCFAAQIDPWRKLHAIDDAEVESVLLATREMMLASVEGAPRPRQVYRRAGEPCRRCGTAIHSRGQGDANRTTYWCPGCQR